MLKIHQALLLPGYWESWILSSHGQARLRWRTVWESKFSLLSISFLHAQSLFKHTIRRIFPYLFPPHFCDKCSFPMPKVQENFLPSLHIPQGLEHSWALLSHEPDTIYMSASPQCKSGSLSPVEKTLNEVIAPWWPLPQSRKGCWPHSCSTTTRPSAQEKAWSLSPSISAAVVPMTYSWDGGTLMFFRKLY